MSQRDPFEPSARDVLVGRCEDLDRIRVILEAPNRGRSLLLSGDAGVGKTVLVDAVAELVASAGTRVLRATGVEFEADVSYSGLNQALIPLHDEFDDLTDTHRDALSVALGLRGGPPRPSSSCPAPSCCCCRRWPRAARSC